MKFLYASLLFICTFSSINSQTIVTDRPDQTESSSTISINSLQLETGILLGFNSNDISSEQQLLAPTTLFRYGLSNKIELRVLSQFERITNQKTDQKINGISDLEIGFKAQLFQREQVNTEIAFLSHAVLPTGSSGLRSDTYGTVNKLSIAHQLTKTIGLGYNVGYNYFGDGNGDFTYSIAFGLPVSSTVGVYIEPFGEWIEFNDHQSSLDAGFTYLIKDSMQADFSFGTGINHTMNYLSIGLSVLIESNLSTSK